MQWMGLSDQNEGRLIATFLALLFLIVIRRIILFLVNRNTENIGVQYHWRKVTSYSSFGIWLLIVAGIWFQGFRSVSTYLGLLSAGIAIALQIPLTNLAGWIFILWRRPFSVGDRIQIGELRGDVIDQKIFMFSVLEIGNWVDAEQSTGRVVHVPNGKVFSEAISNYEEGFKYIWNEIPVLVTFESNWQKAKVILEEISVNHDQHLSKATEEEVRAAAGKMMIFLSKLTPIVYTSVRDHGVLLTIRYLCNPRKRRGSEEEIWEDILCAFSEQKDIDFAYPTQRYYLNHLEGKSGARAEPDKSNQSDK
ncbi:MAG: mechanosensitive ion channel family protein [Pyrinomonadaceae bacterium]|nr:mechanosensitive ion channel family protein [Pyrinomonadaceae bacterium]